MVIKLNELAQRRNAVVVICGEELVARAEANLRSLFDNAGIFIRIEESDLEYLLRDGRYKTIFETRAEEAKQDPTGDIAKLITRRLDGEEKLFGYQQNFPPENRPIYGYLAKEANSPEAAIVGLAYGENIAIKLSQNVKSRTTFTGDDSLFIPANGHRMTRQPSMLQDPNIASFLSLEDIANTLTLQDKLQRIASAQNLNDLTAIKQQHFYFEVQIHNQLTLKDINKIIYIGLQPSQKVIQIAREKGVIIYIL